MKNGTFRKLAAGIFAAAMVLTLAPVAGQTVEAEAKPYIDSEKNVTIPIGKITKNSAWTGLDDYGEQYFPSASYYGRVLVADKEKGKKITYTSSNAKVVSVDSKGWLTGKKKGSAKITVKSGKKKVGTVKVQVKGSGVMRNSSDSDIALGESMISPITYQNQGASYSLTADKPDEISFRQLKGEESSSFMANAKKPGTYKITIKEKYKKKTKKLGSINITVHEPSIVTEPVKLYLKSEMTIESICEYSNDDVKADLIEGEGTVLKYTPAEKVGSTYDFYDAVGLGEAKFQITWKGNALGTVAVDVVLNHCTGLKLDSDVTYDSDEGECPGFSLSLDSDSDVRAIYPWQIDVTSEDNVYECSEDITFSSDDDSIIKVEKVTGFDDEDADLLDYEGYIIRAVAVGDTTITATCGSQTLKIPVHVVNSYWDD